MLLILISAHLNYKIYVFFKFYCGGEQKTKCLHFKYFYAKFFIICNLYRPIGYTVNLYYIH